jgi:hypothetical protein
MLSVTGDFQALAELRAALKAFSKNFGKETTRTFAANLPDLYRVQAEKTSQLPSSVRLGWWSGAVEVVFEANPTKPTTRRSKAKKAPSAPRGFVPRGWEELAVTSALKATQRFLGGE